MNRRSMILGCVAALLSVAVLAAMPARVRAGPEAAATVGAAIGVQVVNEAGKPVPGAYVGLMTADGKKVALHVTNWKGRTLFAPVKPGDYVIKAVHPKFGKGLAKATAVEGELSKVLVKLKSQ